MATLIGDRFFQTAAGWHDLTTGRLVSLRVGTPPADVARRQQHCRSVFDRIPLCGRRLIDYGPTGQTGWFEAWDHGGDDRMTTPHAMSEPALRRITRPAVAELVQIAEGASHHGVERVTIAAPRGGGLHVALNDVARELRALGFVIVRADAPLPSSIRRHLLHRHLVLLSLTQNAHAAAVGWAAKLAATSSRGHLLLERVTDGGATAGRSVCLSSCAREELMAAFDRGNATMSDDQLVVAVQHAEGWPGRFVAALNSARHDGRVMVSMAREAASPMWSDAAVSAWPVSLSIAGSGAAALALGDRTALVNGVHDRGEPPDARLDRAMACRRRGRLAAGERWLVASVEAQRRRGNRDEALRMVETWVPRLLASGRWQRAASLATRALRDTTDPAARAGLARAAGWAYLEGAALCRAEACVETASCIDLLLHGRVTSATAALRAATRLWQGRWREGRSELAALPREAEVNEELTAWQSLLEWADDRDHPPRHRVASTGGTRAWWAWAAAVMRASDMSTEQLTAMLKSASDVPDRWRHVIEAQAWIEAGDVDHARRIIRARPLRQATHRGLAECAAVAIRHAVGLAVEADRRWLDAVVARERMRGVGRWGQGRSDMQMLQDVTKLLEIVQGAEDEHAGLRAVCQWAVDAGGADRCAVVSAPTGDVVAGDALEHIGVARAHVRTWLDHPAAKLEESDALAHARAPIRYGGSPVGLILAVTSRARARALFDAVQAAGAVCGALLRARLDAINSAARTDGLARDILGGSSAIESVRSAVARAAAAPFPVVVEGESGTGKELVARALHRLSPRRDRTFAALNCAALTDELVEAELFGHARGAFTHAVNARAGLFEEAHQGTLFLDEVGDLSPRAQAKLLRVLQEGEIRRVGENDARAVDVRVVAATNRPLAQLAAEGRFREDLMFRLSVVRITVPPLRDRPGDLPELAAAFWRIAARRVGTRAMLGPDALAALAQMSWPGNVRQLQNAMAAIAVAAPNAGRVTARLVRQVLEGLCDARLPGGTQVIVPLEEARRQVERQLVTAALARYTGSRTAAAEALGLSRQGLSKAVRRLGLAHAGVA